MPADVGVLSPFAAGAFHVDIESGRLVFDDRLVELFGHTRADFDGQIESFSGRSYADDAEWTGATLAAGVERGRDLALEMWHCWCSRTGRCIRLPTVMKVSA